MFKYVSIFYEIFFGKQNPVTLCSSLQLMSKDRVDPLSIIIFKLYLFQVFKSHLYFYYGTTNLKYDNIKNVGKA